LWIANTTSVLPGARSSVRDQRRSRPRQRVGTSSASQYEAARPRHFCSAVRNAPGEEAGTAMEDRSSQSLGAAAFWGPQYSLQRDGRIKFGQGLQGKPTLPRRPRDQTISVERRLPNASRPLGCMLDQEISVEREKPRYLSLVERIAVSSGNSIEIPTLLHAGAARGRARLLLGVSTRFFAGTGTTAGRRLPLRVMTNSHRLLHSECTRKGWLASRAR